MVRTEKILLGFLIARTIIFSAPEEAYIELEMKGQTNEFYRVLLDEETEELYLGVGDFIDFAKIEDLKFDKKSLRIKGNLDREKIIDIKLPKEGLIETEDDVYIKLEDFKKYFQISSSNWDAERYILNLDPEFKTAKEYKMELNNQRSLLAMAKKEQELEEKGDYVQKEKALISPGILKVSYNNSDIEENEYSIDLDYGTQLFYGEFQVSQKVYPESDLDYIRLQYAEVFGSYYLTFGDFYLESDAIFDAERSLRGVSFSKNEFYGFRVNNRTVIEGEAYNANLVELYRNGNLDDYQIVTDNNFRFDVINLSSTDKYTIKIFYRDGREETKTIYVLGNQNILNKGENDFVIQVGEGVDDKKLQSLVKYSHGVTKDLTLTVGSSILENREGDKYDVAEGAFAYRFGLEEYPTLLSGTVLEDFNSNELNFKSVVEQGLPANTNFTFRYEDYGVYTSERLRKEKSYNIDLSKGFRRMSGSVGYFKSNYEDDDLYQIYLNLDYNLSRNVRLSLSNEYYKYSTRSDGITSKVEGYGSQAKINYSGIDGFNAILEGKVGYEENDMIEDEIKLGIIKNPSEKGFFSSIDSTFEVGHSREKGTFFEIRFTYIFDDNIYIEFPDITSDDSGTQVGGRIEKSFYLGNPLLKINNNNVTDGWVEGKVFVDENSNGIMDGDEKEYEGAEIISSGGSSVVKEDGKYIIGNIGSRDIHTVEVNRESIDPMLIQGKEVIKYKGAIASGVKVDIPLSPVSMISGFVEANSDIEERKYMGVLSGLDIILKRDGEEISKTEAEIDGYYYFENVLPGDYSVEIVPTSKRYNGSYDKKEIKIKVSSGREGDYYEDNNFLVESVEVVEDKIEEDSADENKEEGADEKAV
ncbi:MAG: hypothetical protein RSE03_05175 [Cetobacterium sp.]|uniref:hypothetical protein n=2 Tax=Cetobacterium sp. TaxID=2071632 RepID=UPI002FC82BB2